jgi:hypothetical protein
VTLNYSDHEIPHTKLRQKKEVHHKLTAVIAIIAAG